MQKRCLLMIYDIFKEYFGRQIFFVGGSEGLTSGNTGTHLEDSLTLTLASCS